MWTWLRRLRRERLLAQPFPEAWEPYLLRNVAHYGLLTEDERARLRDHTRVLVAEKYWEGCGGLRVTDEMKVTIAAQAALLLLGSEGDYFRRVLSVLVYPSAFRLPLDDWREEYERGGAAAGLAAYRGPVVLAWDHTLAAGRDPSRGYNVVIHEFAHQLDFLDGYVNGTPALASPEQAERWRAVMTAEYERLRRDVAEGRTTFLRGRAAANETEFFSVASESFFTLPAGLRQHHPPLYDLLAEFYGVEPVGWFARAGQGMPSSSSES
jgi:Mlc titration factor MtfA (ptsG expression regulator)